MAGGQLLPGNYSYLSSHLLDTSLEVMLKTVLVLG